MSSTLIYIIFGAFLLLVIWFVYRKNFKRLAIACVTLITGAVKTGKSLLGVYLSQKKYKKVHRLWWIKTRIFKKKIEEPLFYTNVWVTFGRGKKPHKLDKNIRLIELKHLLRLKRFNYKSVIYIDECSLMADNMDWSNKKRNACLSMFNKLIGHETRGGYLFYDTQALEDNHYSIKRVLSNFFFIQKSKNFFFFRVLYVREMISKEIGENNFIDDLDTTTRKVLIFRWWYNHYDRYYFSYLTDRLPRNSKKPKFYKGALVSFNPIYRKLSLMNKEVREYLLKEFDKMLDEQEEVFKNEKN